MPVELQKKLLRPFSGKSKRTGLMLARVSQSQAVTHLTLMRSSGKRKPGTQNNTLSTVVVSMW